MSEEPGGDAQDGLREAAILHEQLSYLAEHVCSACPQCNECTRFFRVKELLLAPFEEVRPQLKVLRLELACAEQRLSPSEAALLT